MSPFRLGANNEPNNLYVGSDAVQRIYHGSEQVWPTPAPEGEESATINIERRSVTGVAPEACIFSISLSDFDTAGPGAGEVYDPRFHELYYYWDFDDAYTYTAPENLHPAHLNANVAYGPKASHTFRAPGTYTVTCLVVEPVSGKSATATLNVTVSDPDLLFSGINTIFLSPSGDFTDAPLGARQLTSGDLSGAITTWGLGDSSTPKRIMLNRGETFTSAGNGLMGRNGQVPTLHIVAGPGAGAKPVVNVTGETSWWDDEFTSTNSTKDWIIQNIDFFGSYDSSTDTGTSFGFIATFQSPPSLFLMDGCLIDGFGAAINNTGLANSDYRTTVLNDTVITNFEGAGYLDSNKFASAMTGSRISSKVDALVDTSENGGVPFRDGGRARLTIIHSCDFYSRQGWGGHGSIIAAQACIRVDSEPDGQNVEVVCQTSSFEGGFSVMEISIAGGSVNPINAIFEKNYIVGGHATSGMIAVDYGAATVRNNIMVAPSTDRMSGTNNTGSYLRMITVSSDPGAGFLPNRLYNNTLVNLDPDMSPVELSVNDAVTDATAENNVVRNPGFTDLQTTPTLWTAREIGYEDSTTALQTQTATPGDTVALYAPQAGSPAIGAATGSLIAYDDFFGNPRPASPSRGALEPS